MDCFVQRLFLASESHKTEKQVERMEKVKSKIEKWVKCTKPCLSPNTPSEEPLEHLISLAWKSNLTERNIFFEHFWQIVIWRRQLWNKLHAGHGNLR